MRHGNFGYRYPKEDGLASFDLPDGPDWTPAIKASFKPKAIEQNGTKVTLLGTTDEMNTCFPPEDAGKGMNWLITYLTGRYFRVPENVKLQVRVLTKDTDGWPQEEPSPSEKTFNFQTVKGAKALFDNYATDSGTVSLSTADAHWWLFDDASKASKDMSTRGGRTSRSALSSKMKCMFMLPLPRHAESLPDSASCSERSTL